MKRMFLAASVMVVLLVAPAPVWAQVKVVQFKDGRPPLIGTVTESADSYEVVTRTGKQVVPMDQVASISDYVTPREEFRKRQAALTSGDVSGHYSLADWAYKQGLLEDARAELKIVLSLQSGHENAKLLLSLVEKDLQSQQKEPAGPRHSTHSTPSARSDRLGELMAQMMSMDDVQRIRRAELRRGDRVTVEFRNDVLRRFVEAQTAAGRFKDPADARAFYSQPPADQVAQIVEEMPAATEILDDIIVKSDPRFMSMFKRNVWPIVSARCASPECHGRPRGAGGLKLYAVPVQDDRVYYTNFYILDAYESGHNRLIDRNAPARSLLLHYGLPPDESRKAHPNVRGLNLLNEVQYQAILEWISNVLANPRPTYGLTYRAPGEKPKASTLSLGSQPATHPASRPATRPASRPAAPPAGRINPPIR